MRCVGSVRVPGVTCDGGRMGEVLVRDGGVGERQGAEEDGRRGPGGSGKVGDPR